MIVQSDLSGICMIDFSETLEELHGRIALTCADGMDARSLIFAADNAARMRAAAVSCDPNSVNMLWTWLEKSKIKIFARISVPEPDLEVQKIAAAIHTAFKKGAAGVQLIVTPAIHEKLATALSPIAADLFFGRELILTFDLDDVVPDDWPRIFNSLKIMGAAGLGLLVSKSDYTAGAIYGMLDHPDYGFCGRLNIISKDSDLGVIEDTWRLTKKIRPELIPGIVFFLNQ